VAGAVLAVVVGSVTIGRLTAPEAAPETTSTTLIVSPPSTTTTAPPFHVSQIEQGDPIEWQRVAIFDRSDQGVVAVEYRAGTFHVFTAISGQGPEVEHRGLVVRTSTDGLTWETRAVIGSHFRPFGVIANDSNFFAYGVEQGGTPVVWTSATGETWDRVELPGQGVPGTSVSFQASHANDDLVLLVAQEYLDVTQALLDSVVNTSFPGLRANLEQRSWDPAEWTVELSGPLWIPLLSLGLDEVGLTPAAVEQARARDSGHLVAWIGPPEGDEWRRVALADMWDPGEAPFHHLERLLTGPDGRMWGQGYGYSGWRTYATADGVDWERVESLLNEFPIERWGDTFVSVGHRLGQPTLRVSADLETWESLETNRFLAAGQNWSSESPVPAAGPAGVALTVRSRRVREVPVEPLTVERDGYTLEVGAGQTRLLRGSEEVTGQNVWWGTGQRDTRLSEDGTAVVFADPRTGEDLVTFTLAELRAVEEAALTRPQSSHVLHDHHVMLFSSDGDEWTIQDLGGIVGPHGWLNHLVIGSDRVVLVVGDSWRSSSSVWVGIPPD
jgi:hypothetical protein